MKNVSMTMYTDIAVLAKPLLSIFISPEQGSTGQNKKEFYRNLEF